MTTEFSIGQHIGDYEILSVLGLGGMGKVYKVRNVISDRVEAMKILLPDLMSHQSLADRFLREIRLLASLNHPNIASLRTALNHDNQLVMIMEFVEGETLANRLSRAPISTAEAVDYSDQILTALSYAHKQGIIHRDIKPANMMLTPQGVVKLMDFGIARSATDGTLTSTGTTLGSLNYMPPEQVRGESADARSDIYSFGVSLYELLTGKLPFQADSQYSLMTAHLNQMPVAPITMRTDLPASLNEIIMMAMAKDPAHRFQTADAFRAALKSVPVSPLARSGTTVTPTPRMSSSETTLVGTPLPSVSTAAMPAYTPAPATKTQKPATTPPAAPVSTVAATQPGPPVVPPAAIPPRTSSGRGLWVAIGALVGIGALIAAGIYIPRRVLTHAEQDKPASVANGSATTGSATSGGSTAEATSSSPASPGIPSVSVKTDQGSFSVDPQGNVSVKTPDGSFNASVNGDVKINGKSGTKIQTSRTGSDAAGTGGGTNVQVTTPTVPAGPSPEEIAKVEDEADKMNVRGATVSQSLDTLKQQQAASGYGLRADMASAQERMKVYLAKGNSALQARDLVNAKKYFDLAEGELAKLEKFLGH
ncbi:MAG TPA: protein kinase [Candidatus Acidoferrum sp.]|jgi:serine/threonine protein kinase